MRMRSCARPTAGALLALLLAGPPVLAETLEEALIQSYTTNPELSAQRARLRATDEEVAIALGGWRPNLRLRGDAFLRHQRVDENVNNETQKQEFTEEGFRPGVNLRLTQPLYSGGETVARTRRAENTVLAERARLTAREQQVFNDVVEAYSAVLRDAETLALAEDNVRRLREALDAAQRRFSVGEVTRTDVDQAISRLARGQADLTAAQANLQDSTAAYERAVGRLPGRLLPAPLARGLPQNLLEAYGRIDDHPEVIAARYEAAAAEDAVEVARAAIRPTLDLAGELSYNREPSALVDRSREAAVGLTLNVPLYQGGGEYARVRQARQQAQQRQGDLERAQRIVREEIKSSWEALVAARDRIAFTVRQVEGAERALEGVRRESVLGSRTILDVLDAEQELFSARVNLARTKRDELFNGYRLKAAVGDLTVPSLALPVEPYDADAYYRANRNRLFGTGD